MGIIKKFSVFLLAVAFLVACNRQEEAVMYGNFEADEWIIPAGNSGKIIWLDLQEGGRYEAGQLVGMIDTIPFALEKEVILAQIDALRASLPDISVQTDVIRQKLSALEREQERVARLVEQGSADRQMLERLEDEMAVTERELLAVTASLRQESDRIRAQIRSLQAQTEVLEDRMERCRILNPESGVVLTRYASIHEYVAAGQPLYRLANMEEMILSAWFSGEQLSDLRLGDHMQVSIDIPGQGMKHYRGKVLSVAEKPQFTPTQVQTQANRVKQHYQVKISVPNDGSIKPGIPGEVRFAGNTTSHQ
jgi:HlyD family secretion protein